MIFIGDNSTLGFELKNGEERIFYDVILFLGSGVTSDNIRSLSYLLNPYGKLILAV